LTSVPTDKAIRHRAVSINLTIILSYDESSLVIKIQVRYSLAALEFFTKLCSFTFNIF